MLFSPMAISGPCLIDTIKPKAKKGILGICGPWYAAKNNIVFRLLDLT